MNLSGPAQLTDKGKQTTFELGKRIRFLYVDQLSFLPTVLCPNDSLYLRSSPHPRAMQSLHQVFEGLYPTSKRSNDLSAPRIFTKPVSEETLMPNENFCPRFVNLIKAYSTRSAQRCEQSPTRLSLTIPN